MPDLTPSERREVAPGYVIPIKTMYFEMDPITGFNEIKYYEYDVLVTLDGGGCDCRYLNLELGIAGGFSITSEASFNADPRAAWLREVPRMTSDVFDHYRQVEPEYMTSYVKLLCTAVNRVCTNLYPNPRSHILPYHSSQRRV